MSPEPKSDRQIMTRAGTSTTEERKRIIQFGHRPFGARRSHLTEAEIADSELINAELAEKIEEPESRVALVKLFR
jgi:hypothetical protein